MEWAIQAKLGKGFVPSSRVTDACSPKVVGWAAGVQINSDLVRLALHMAVELPFANGFEKKYHQENTVNTDTQLIPALQ